MSLSALSDLITARAAESATVAPATDAPATDAPAAPATDAPTLNALALTNARAAGAIAWQTKSGTVKQAHSEIAKAQAPRAARIVDAQQATLRALHNGQYRPFLRDLLDGLTPAAVAGLKAATHAAMATVINGVSYAPTGDVFATPNKALILALAAWARAPYGEKTVKGVTVQSPLKASKALTERLAVVVQFADDIAASEAAKLAGTESV